MENIPLGHLSRPQLVNLLLRIVDLLSQPVQPFQPAQPTQACPVLEPYDASVDPWNAPEPTQPVNVSGQGVSCPVTTSGTAYPPGLLNPGASAFYPMVPGACCSYSNGGTCEPSPEPAPGLPRFGSFPQADLAPFTSSCPPVANTHGEGCVNTGVNVPRDSAFPGGGPGRLGDVPQRLVCGCKCDACEAPCVLQCTGHSMHRCTLHKIP